MRAVDLLLKSGGNPNVAPANNSSTIEMAAMMKDIEMLKLLVDRGGDVNLRNPDDGRTPLFSAAMIQNRSSMDFLLASGADLEARSSRDYTPLLYSVMSNAYESALFLVEKGANLDATSNAGTDLKTMALRNRMDPESDAAQLRKQLIDLYEARSKRLRQQK